MGGTVERELGIEDVCEIYSHCIHFSATVEQVTQNMPWKLYDYRCH
jgi:hypothetical protein